MVEKVASSLSTASRVPIQPRSRALAVDMRYRPILVGEVRWATIGRSVSWKLSGGNMWSDVVTKVSKNRHVCRAIKRRAAASGSVAGRRPAIFGGRPTPSATAGETNQITANAVASGQAPRPQTRLTATAAAPMKSAPTIRR